MTIRRIMQAKVTLTVINIFLYMSFFVYNPHLSGQTPPPIFYVATTGSDAWSGKLPEQNANKTDGPFATLERAREAIRQLKSTGAVNTPVTVMIRGGVYYFSKPFILRPEDSGTEKVPILYTAYPNEKPVITGGRKINGWKRAERDLWMAEVPEAKTGTLNFRQLFINGERCRRARLPNSGVYKIVKGAKPAEQSFCFDAGNIKKDWKNLKDVEIVVLQYWMESRLRISRVDEVNQTVTFTGGSWRSLTWSTGYYVENLFEGLDEPGEWYLNRSSGIVYYKAKPGEDLIKAEVIAPVTEQLIRLEGDAASGRFVNHVTFKNISFSYTGWTLPEQGYSEPQAEIHAGAALYGTGVRYCSFEDNEIAHLGGWAIELSRGCKDNRIAGNHIYDVGGGGIKIGEPKNAERDEEETSRTVISDNLIHDGCRVYLGAAAIWIGQSSGNCVSHNEIYGAWQWAISVGWTWAYMPPQRARDNIVEYNHCHHLGESELGTHATIYFLGVQPGSVCRYNLIHHITGWAGHGICLDNGSVGMTVEYNVVHHTNHGAWVGNYNDLGNVVQNNVFALAKGPQYIRYGDEPPKGEKVHQTGIFYRNIYYWNEGRLIGVDTWSDNEIIMDYNLYFNAGGNPIEFQKKTFDEWKAMGFDKNSIVADPLFVDPENGNFTLKPDSPAFKLGFKPIDLSTVGPRKKWK